MMLDLWILLYVVDFTLGEIIRMRRLSRDTLNTINNDNHIKDIIQRKLQTTVSADVSSLISLAYTKDRCIECVRVIPGKACVYSISDTSFTMKLCDQCKKSGYRRLVDYPRVRQVALSLTWKPKSVSGLMKNYVRFVKPQNKGCYLMFAYEVSRVLNQLKVPERTDEDKRRIMNL